MADYCSKCGKKLGLLSFKYKSEDGSVMCVSCLKEHKMKQKELEGRGEQEKQEAEESKRQEKFREREELRKQEELDEHEKHREIMRDYISKYLANKDQEYIDCILDTCNEGNEGIEDNILGELLGESEVLDIIEEYNPELQFYEDLEKFYNLFKKKGIETNKSEILSVFAECISGRASKQLKESFEEADKYLIPIVKGLSIKLGENPTKENVIKEFMKFMKKHYAIDVGDPETGFLWLSTVLEKFNIPYEQDEVEELIEKIKEEIELEDFEKKIGAAPRKQRIEIGNFTELSGYEFEEYLKNLFALLGYTTVQTSLSGDQGADLILSKDDEKIVVQAKKYDGNVSNKAVQEIAAAKNYYNADKAMVVTNSSFTKSAIELAFSNDVELWDGRKLKSIIGDLESKSEDSGLLFHEYRQFKRGEEVQNVTMTCPCCEKEFDYEIDFHPYLELTEEGTLCGAGKHELEINCPYCDFPFGISFEVPLKPPGWGCSFCGKEFETKAAAEEHEKTCEGRRREN